MKQVTLKSQAWHTRVWDYVYDSVPPNNLCPYFWGLILSIPLAPFRYLYDHWPHPNWEFPSFPPVPEPGERFFVTFLAVVTVIYFLGGIYGGWVKVLGYSALVVAVLGAMFGIYLTLDYLHSRNKIPSNPLTPAAEAIESKYHAYCPQITWNEKK